MAHVTENTTGLQAFTATATAIGLGVRVKLDSSGNISAAGATDAWIGTTTEPVAASGTGTVKLLSAPGTRYVVAAGAISVGSRLFAAASGKVNDVQASGPPTGLIAKTAAGADGDIIEAAPVSVPNIPFEFALPVTLAQIAGAGDVLTTRSLGFAGTITAIEFAVTSAVTTAAKAATLNVEIGTTNLTGGTVELTSANCATLGAVVASAAITANNTFAAGDTLSVEAASVTAFAEGAGVLYISGFLN